MVETSTPFNATKIVTDKLESAPPTDKQKSKRSKKNKAETSLLFDKTIEMVINASDTELETVPPTVKQIARRYKNAKTETFSLIDETNEMVETHAPFDKTKVVTDTLPRPKDELETVPPTDKLKSKISKKNKAETSSLTDEMVETVAPFDKVITVTDTLPRPEAGLEIATPMDKLKTSWSFNKNNKIEMVTGTLSESQAEFEATQLADKLKTARSKKDIVETSSLFGKSIEIEMVIHTLPEPQPELASPPPSDKPKSKRSKKVNTETSLHIDEKIEEVICSFPELEKDKAETSSSFDQILNNIQPIVMVTDILPLQESELETPPPTDKRKTTRSKKEKSLETVTVPSIGTRKAKGKRLEEFWSLIKAKRYQRTKTVMDSPSISEDKIDESPHLTKKKKLGRPPKKVVDVISIHQTEPEETIVETSQPLTKKKKLGRPPKKVVDVISIHQTAPEENMDETSQPLAKKKKLGRPPKKVIHVISIHKTGPEGNIDEMYQPLAKKNILGQLTKTVEDVSSIPQTETSVEENNEDTRFYGFKLDEEEESQPLDATNKILSAKTITATLVAELETLVASMEKEETKDKTKKLVPTIKENPKTDLGDAVLTPKRKYRSYTRDKSVETPQPLKKKKDKSIHKVESSQTELETSVKTNGESESQEEKAPNEVVKVLSDSYQAETPKKVVEVQCDGFQVETPKKVVKVQSDSFPFETPKKVVEVQSDSFPVEKPNEVVEVQSGRFQVEKPNEVVEVQSVSLRVETPIDKQVKKPKIQTAGEKKWIPNDRPRRATSVCRFYRNVYVSPKVEKKSRGGSLLSKEAKAEKSIVEDESCTLPSTQREPKKRGRKRKNLLESEKPIESCTPSNADDALNPLISLSVDDNIKVGDILWARIAHYPFWPCLVVTQPESEIFKKKISKMGDYNWYHVRFYADRGRRCWCSQPNLMRFKSKDDLTKIISWREAHSIDKIIRYSVKARFQSRWNLAVEEASSQKLETIEARLEFFETLLKNEIKTGKKPLLSKPPEDKVKSPKLSSAQHDLAVSSTRFVRSKSLPPSAFRNCTIFEEKSVNKKDVADAPSRNAKIALERDKPREIKNTGIKNSFHSPLRKFAQLSNSEETPRSSPEGDLLYKIALHKKEKLANEINSEYSLSDSDTLSKTSTSSRFQDLVLQQRLHNLFKGISRSYVCQICTIPGEVLRCQGPCKGVFHSHCIKRLFDSQNVETSIGESKTVSSTEVIEVIHKDQVENADDVQPDLVKLSLADQIDLKMQEVMSHQESYADSTTDYTSSEESLVDINAIDKRKLFKFRSNSCVASITERTLAPPSINQSQEEYKCDFCSINLAPPCFACGKKISDKNESLRQRCSITWCGRVYHPLCVKQWPHTQWSLTSTIRYNDIDMGAFVCPAHVCHTCSADNPRAFIPRLRSDKVVKCLRCPAAYHSNGHCIPAGSQIFTSSQIICPDHFERALIGGKHRTLNARWCFVCSNGGQLVCCEKCPTSVHSECLHIDLREDGTYLCEECQVGRFPLYGEIVWVKWGVYRWWPAIILFPSEVPKAIQILNHNKGEFVVKFYGTHDHYWVHRGRVFVFEEGDKCHTNTVNSKVDVTFVKSVEEAAAAHQLKNAYSQSIKADRQLGSKPPPYRRIKSNRPVGNVKMVDGNISNTTSCDCDPSHPYPCGPDSVCLNRILLTECDPNICPAKDNCNNQRFEKRQYPPLVPYKTETRGWGLKTLAPIYKGEFVIEYVGELIDEQEYQRRIRIMHEMKDENYYFLTIDPNRIIDAGPKGNVARFMNHCCKPNCETQKWTVNGDTRVGLFAMEDIPADSEVTFDYRLQCVSTGKKICACGAPNCRGFIGDKSKLDESQKKLKKNSVKQKKVISTSTLIKNDGVCFVCGKSGNLGACQNKICTKLYHLKCVNLKCWPEGKWVCSWHNCNICNKRTIRCCVKCINAYCPMHSDGNVRHDKLLGFICSEHDPTKESQDILNQNVASVQVPNGTSTTNVYTEETDVTSTTVDENDRVENINEETLSNLEPSTSNSKQNLPLEACENGFTTSDCKNDLKQETQTKRKRGVQRKSLGANKRIKLSPEAAKSASAFTPPILDNPLQNEIKLSSTVPVRHLRTSRKVSSGDSEIKQLIKRQSEYEKDLPIRKRTTPRCEVNP